MLQIILFLSLISFPLAAQEAESECWNEPGLGYEYYDYAQPQAETTPCCRYFENDAHFGRCCGLRGIWLPEAPALFAPLAADPREICFSLAWRAYDRAFHVNNMVAVSYANDFPVYRWFNVWPFRGGELQVDIQGALWAVFEPCEFYKPLINADYYVGVPITYACGCWSFRFRGYHISSHIGDEFMVLNPDCERLNPSAEFLDFFVSYDKNCSIRLYGGIGGSVTQDCSFKCGRAFLQAGMEIRVAPLRYYSWNNRYCGVPLFAMNFSIEDKCNNHINNTYVLGYEWEKLSGWHHKTRIFLEYHDGYSFEGQFSMRPTKYFAIKATYGL